MDIRVQIRKLDKDGNRKSATNEKPVGLPDRTDPGSDASVLVHHNWRPEDGGDLAPGQDEGIWTCEDVNIYTLQGL